MKITAPHVVLTQRGAQCIRCDALQSLTLPMATECIAVILGAFAASHAPCALGKRPEAPKQPTLPNIEHGHVPPAPLPAAVPVAPAASPAAATAAKPKRGRKVAPVGEPPPAAPYSPAVVFSIARADYERHEDSATRPRGTGTSLHDPEGAKGPGLGWADDETYTRKITEPLGAPRRHEAIRAMLARVGITFEEIAVAAPRPSETHVVFFADYDAWHALEKSAAARLDNPIPTGKRKRAGGSDQIQWAVSCWPNNGRDGDESYMAHEPIERGPLADALRAVAAEIGLPVREQAAPVWTCLRCKGEQLATYDPLTYGGLDCGGVCDRCNDDVRDAARDCARAAEAQEKPATKKAKRAAKPKAKAGAKAPKSKPTKPAPQSSKGIEIVLRADEQERLAELPGGAAALLWDGELEIAWDLPLGDYDDGAECVSEPLSGEALARARAFLDAHAHGWVEQTDAGRVPHKTGLAPTKPAKAAKSKRAASKPAPVPATKKQIRAADAKAAKSKRKAAASAPERDAVRAQVDAWDEERRRTDWRVEHQTHEGGEWIVSFYREAEELQRLWDARDIGSVTLGRVRLVRADGTMVAERDLDAERAAEQSARKGEVQARHDAALEEHAAAPEKKASKGGSKKASAPKAKPAKKRAKVNGAEPPPVSPSSGGSTAPSEAETPSPLEIDSDTPRHCRHCRNLATSGVYINVAGEDRFYCERCRGYYEDEEERESAAAPEAPAARPSGAWSVWLRGAPGEQWTLEHKGAKGPAEKWFRDLRDKLGRGQAVELRDAASVMRSSAERHLTVHAEVHRGWRSVRVTIKSREPEHREIAQRALDAGFAAIRARYPEGFNLGRGGALVSGAKTSRGVTEGQVLGVDHEETTPCADAVWAVISAAEGIEAARSGYGAEGRAWAAGESAPAAETPAQVTEASDAAQ